MKIEQLQDEIHDLPRAEMRDVFVEGEKAEGRAAVWNVTDDRLAEIVSDRYQIVQHEDFFGRLIGVVEALDMDVSSCGLTDEREAAYVEIVFERQFGVEGILTGMRAGNSFDKTCRAFAEIYALRQICTNGVMGAAISGRVGRLHVGGVDVERLASGFVRQIDVTEVEFTRLVTSAAGDHVDVEVAELAMTSLNIGTRHVDYVLDKIEGGTVSRWDLYNYATEYVENELDRTERGREKLHNRANKLLTNDSETLEEIAARERE